MIKVGVTLEIHGYLWFEGSSWVGLLLLLDTSQLFMSHQIGTNEIERD